MKQVPEAALWTCPSRTAGTWPCPLSRTTAMRARTIGSENIGFLEDFNISINLMYFRIVSARMSLVQSKQISPSKHKNLKINSLRNKNHYQPYKI